MIEEKDRRLLKEMSKGINHYLKAASYLSDEIFNELSKYNGLYWSELEEQKEIIKKLLNQNNIEDERNVEGNENRDGKDDVEGNENRDGKDDVEGNENRDGKDDVEGNENVEGKKDIDGNENTDGKEDVDDIRNIEDIENTENGPIMLYDSMVKYLKKQEFIDHQWVKVYFVKCPQQDNKDFEIKYYEYKDPYAAHKSYISFGDTRKSYSIKKARGEVVGDTEKCFNFILNHRHTLELE
jgi:hypothetical protein